jgi:hypothetical protein
MSRKYDIAWQERTESMTFQQKNNTVSLASFSLLLIFFLLRMVQLVRNQNFHDATVVRLWVIVVVLAIVVTVVGIILTHGIPAAVKTARTGDPEPEIDDTIDERDQHIDLEGTNLTYRITSLGSFVAMLTFALGQSPLVMFSLLIFFGLVGQIAGDALRLRRYQKE